MVTHPHKLAERRRVYIEQLDAVIFALTLAALGFGLLIGILSWLAGSPSLELLAALVGGCPLIVTLTVYQWLHRRRGNRYALAVVLLAPPLLFGATWVGKAEVLAGATLLIFLSKLVAQWIKRAAERAALVEFGRAEPNRSVRFLRRFDRFGDGEGFETYVRVLSGAANDDE